MSESLKKNSIALSFTLIASVLLFIISSHFMLGVSPDSSHYLIGAKNMLYGNGFRGYEGAIINHFPPGYSFFVAMTAKLTGLGMLAAGRALNVVLFGLFFWLINQLLSLTKFNTITLIAINIFLLAGTPLFYVFSYYWSEGISIVLMMAAFYTYAKSDFTPSVGQSLLVGIFLAVLFMVRFAAAGLIVGVAAHLFFFSKHKFGKRILHIILIGVPIVLLFLFWHFYSQKLGVEAVDREIVLHTIPMKKVLKFIFVPLRWILPMYSRVLLLGLLGVLFVMGVLSRKALFRSRIFVFSAIVTLAYCLFLVVSISFIDFATPVDNRILSLIAPLYIIMAVAIVVTFFEERVIPINISTKVVGGVLLLASLLPVYRTLYPQAKKLSKAGLGYNDKNFFSDKVKDHIHNSKGKVIYTNGPDLMNYYLNFKEEEISADVAIKYYPQKHNSGNNVNNTSYMQDMSSMVNAINSDAKNTLVHFNNIKRDYLPTFDAIAQYIDSAYIDQYADCAIIQKQ